MLEYVVLLIIVTLIFMLSSKLEMFDNGMLVTNILPLPDSDAYLVVSLSKKPSQHLQFTYDFNRYFDVKINNKPSTEIIKNIAWGKDTTEGKKLIIITQIATDEEKYKIYISDSHLDINYKPHVNLEPFPDYSGNDIRFIMCDMNNNYIGLKKHTKRETDTSYIFKLMDGNAIPIDTYSDLRLEKLFFDKDNYLCCIAEDNLIYKKKLLDWKKSTWDKTPNKVGRTPVLDVVFDLDGKLIAATNIGIQKQIYTFYNSAFKKYVHVEINDTMLSKKDAFKFKTGIDMLTFDFLNINDYNFDEKNREVFQEQIDTFNETLNFKSQFLHTCSTKENKQLSEIEDNNTLLSDIRSSLADLKSKGYINVV